MLDQLRRKRNAPWRSNTSARRQRIFWPPYTAAEKRQMDAIDYRKPHSGPYVVVYPYARGAGPSLPSRNAAAVAAATNRQTEVTSRSTAEADPAKAPADPQSE